MENECLKLSCVISEEVDPKPLEKNLKQLLVKGEKIIAAYKSTVYFVVFTNKRIVAREQNSDHSNIIINTIPYRSIEFYTTVYDKLSGFTHILKIRTNNLELEVKFKIDVDINSMVSIFNEAVL